MPTAYMHAGIVKKKGEEKRKKEKKKKKKKKDGTEATNVCRAMPRLAALHRAAHTIERHVEHADYLRTTKRLRWHHAGPFHAEIRST